MKGRVLKNHSRYLEKINAYAEAVGVNIEYSHIDSEGSFSPSRRRININPDLSDSEEIAVLLHEFGHFLDDSILHLKPDHELNIAYGRVYQGDPTAHQSALVLECEKRAWEYGKVVAKKLRIPLGKWYVECRQYCLKEYKSGT